MANAEKVAAVAELTERFKDSSGAVLTEYRGLTVAQLAELRRSLGDNATFAVVKNTLTKIARHRGGAVRSAVVAAVRPVGGRVRRRRRGRGREGAARLSPGRTRCWSSRAACSTARRSPQRRSIKLADLEPRDVLLAKLAGAMKASLAGAAATFNALPVQMAQLAEALRAKREAAEGPGGRGRPRPSEADGTAAGDGTAADEG